MKVYFDMFESREDMMRNFMISEKELDGIDILYAEYDGECAQVIFRKDNNIYEVNGSHCSCHGLEDQWTPEPTTVKALLARPNVAEAAKEVLRNL